MLVNGEDKGARGRVTWPKFVEDLEIGGVLEQQGVMDLPPTLLRLKLVGDDYLNSNVSQVLILLFRFFYLT